MNLLVLLLSLTLCNSILAKKISSKWSVKSNIKTPESVYYASEIKQIFVSSIDGEGTKKDGRGHISLLSSSGKVINSKWVSGLNAPKGMRSAKGILWVSDIDELVKIDIASAKVIKKYQIVGAKFLNDIALNTNGDVYVSDTLTSKIHLLRDGKLSIFVEGDKYESPNGLLVVGDELYVAAWGLTTDWSTTTFGRLYSINLLSKKISYISKTALGNLDGLELSNSGEFIVSDWSAGVVYKIKKDGKTVLFYKGKKGLADIGWIPETGSLLIPYMNDNEILGF
jgi:hypothetical protein